MHIYVAYTIEIGYPPPALSGYFNENKEIHPHNTRHKEDFHTYSVLSHEGKKEPLKLKEVYSYLLGISYLLTLKEQSHF